MTQKNYIFVFLMMLSLLTANVSRAAFPSKHVAALPALIVTTGPAAAVPAVSEHAVKHKQSFFARLVHKVAAKAAAMPQILYIILAIIGFGWLAMGVNSSFEGYDWLISLVLYLLFYIPGLIYTLIKMGDYY